MCLCVCWEWFELRCPCLYDRHFTNWTISPALYMFFCLLVFMKHMYMWYMCMYVPVHMYVGTHAFWWLKLTLGVFLDCSLFTEAGFLIEHRGCLTRLANQLAPRIPSLPLRLSLTGHHTHPVCVGVLGIWTQQVFYQWTHLEALSVFFFFKKKLTE